MIAEIAIEGNSRATVVCPYCKEILGPQRVQNTQRIRKTKETIACPRCRTLHHETCWNQNGRCSVFGCIGIRKCSAADAWKLIPALLGILCLAAHGAALQIALLPALFYSLYASVYFLIVLLEHGFVRGVLTGMEIRAFFFYMIWNGLPLLVAVTLILD